MELKTYTEPNNVTLINVFSCINGMDLAVILFKSIENSPIHSTATENSNVPLA